MFERFSRASYETFRKKNIPEWNRQTFKAHEEKIREAVLMWMNLLLQQ